MPPKRWTKGQFLVKKLRENKPMNHHPWIISYILLYYSHILTVTQLIIYARGITWYAGKLKIFKSDTIQALNECYKDIYSHDFLYLHTIDGHKVIQIHDKIYSINAHKSYRSFNSIYDTRITWYFKSGSFMWALT